MVLPSWKKLFEQLEQNRSEIHAILKDLPQEVLSKKPSENEWSLMDICNHLMVIEQLSIGYIRGKIENPSSAKPVPFKNKMKFWMIKVALLLPLKFKAPDAITKIPGPKKYTDLASTWDLTRKELWKVIQKIPDGKEHLTFFKHPIAGHLSIQMMLDFFLFHSKHHLKQIKRTLQKVK